MWIVAQENEAPPGWHCVRVKAETFELFLSNKRRYVSAPNDRPYAVGDYVVVVEIDYNNAITGRVVTRQVTDILFERSGMVVMSIEPC